MPQWSWEAVGGWVRRAVAAALTAGGRPVPRHVAFIMDGNRRFAEAHSLRKVEGHSFGYRRLVDALEWCLELGVCCVSVYAFSIDNYKRSPQEVHTLMELAQEKLAHMLQECDVLARHGVQVRVIGDLSLAPAAVQDAAAAVMRATAHHTRAVLNICFSYTASEELLRALDGMAADTSSSSSQASPGPQGCQLDALGGRHAALAGSTGGPGAASCSTAGDGPAIRSGSLAGSSSSSSSGKQPAGIPGSSSSSSSSGRDAGVASLEKGLYTAGCPPVDLLVRTSGETRLSDFLLWQSRFALLVFTPVLWPDFGFLDLVAAVMEFQRHSTHLRRLQAVAERQAGAAAAAAAGSMAAREAEAGAARAEAWHTQQGQLQVQQQDGLLQPGVQHEQLQAQQPLLQPVKVRPQGSPCSVASPASPSSPSSRSEASAEETQAGPLAGPPAISADAGSRAAALPLRRRPAAAADTPL